MLLNNDSKNETLPKVIADCIDLRRFNNYSVPNKLNENMLKVLITVKVLLCFQSRNFRSTKDVYSTLEHNISAYHLYHIKQAVAINNNFFLSI